MFLLIILLSYLLGCASTIALLLYLYTRYALHSPVVISEQQEDQYQSFHALPEVSQYIFKYSLYIYFSFRVNEQKIQQ